ncbi:MAG: TMEM165/GDT1 family protein [Peptoniphilus sp.]|nr:TMEM165/GDT1 family protein [Peptoniphilus sp.]MDD7363227.1 TMEM165/GDT1 family protein [Bacillota bacterium]MDY6044449.1 TMEM165/GDT1 family protein [Peptoniphilus sp.]
MREFLEAFIMVFIGEMGDKSQFLALAFATAYPMRTVLSGVSIGIALNHGLAIIAAVLIAGVFKNVDFLQLIAGYLFLFFGLSALSIDYEEEEDEVVRSKFGPVVTVAVAFFVGELGDKTQLMAMTLAMQSERPALIFCATVSSMILVSCIGILVGKYVGKKIPKVAISYLAGCLFLFFGIAKIYGVVDIEQIAPVRIILFALLLAIAVLFVLVRNQKRLKKRNSRYLYEAYKRVKNCSTPEEEAEIKREIERITGEYFGEKIPFVGNIIKHVEQIHGIDPEIYDDIKKL